MRCAILAFTAGVLALQNAAALPSTPAMFACTACALLCIVLARHVRRHWAAALVATT